VDSIIKDYIKDYPDLVSLQELYNQFRSEISKHVIKEEFVVFPSIIKFEAIYNDAFIDLTLNHEMIEKLVNDVEMKNQHIEFDLYLSSIIQLLEWSNINNK
jgi:iron-sulfur cluster repair protein YtfE (RIC family)